MHFYHMPSRKTVILWAEKCGCTSLTQWMQYSFSEMKGCKGKPRKFLARKGYNHLNINHLKRLINEEVPVDHLIISHREPVSRMTSSYVNKFICRNGKLIDNQSISKEDFSTQFAAQVLDYEDSRNQTNPKKEIKEGNKSHSFSLETFLDFITSEHVSLRRVNSHFTPQVEHVRQWRKIKMIMGHAKTVHPLRVDRFNSDLERINSEMGLDFIPVKENSTELPSSEWGYSSQAETGLMKPEELWERKLIPNKHCTLALLSKNDILQERFRHTFRFDNRLRKLLDNPSEQKK